MTPQQYGTIADINLHGWNCRRCKRHVIGPTVAGGLCARCEQQQTEQEAKRLARELLEQQEVS